MMINADNPTVSSISPTFIDAARDASGWETQRWTKSVDVAVTTIDALIAKHGRPAFIKLDVEGYEAEALQGLSQAVRALSFEFTTIQRDVALACIERCSVLGYAQLDFIHHFFGCVGLSLACCFAVDSLWSAICFEELSS